MRRALIEGEGAHSVRGAVRGQDSGKAASPSGDASTAGSAPTGEAGGGREGATPRCAPAAGAPAGGRPRASQAAR